MATIKLKKSEIECIGDEVIIRLSSDEINGLLAAKVPLSDITPGETFKVGDFEFIVLDQMESGTAVLLKQCLPDERKFDEDTNDWQASDLRNYLNTEFLHKLESAVGKENIIAHAVNLTTDDGLKDYGICEDKISLITTDMYRQYRQQIGEPINTWWWTLTALSKTDNTDCVRVVYDFGLLLSIYCYCSGGVRPFCILNSNILVSK